MGDKRLTLLVSLIGMIFMALLSPIQFAKAASRRNSYPGYATSYYIYSADQPTFYNRGCTLGEIHSNRPGVQVQAVIIDMGQPWKSGNRWGVRRFDGAFVPVSTVPLYAKAFAQGYYDCRKDSSSIRLVMAVNNYGSYVGWTFGEKWASMINSLNGWATGLYGAVKFRGGIDAEPGWSSPSDARAWSNGYATYTDYPYYDFGSAPCNANPDTQGGTPSSCGGGWNQDDVYWMAYGPYEAWPFPEIYNIYWTNARQWQSISIYSHKKYGWALYFLGSLTQYQACHQRSCDPSEMNTPYQGWYQLITQIQRRSDTWQSVLYYASDIMWQQ